MIVYDWEKATVGDQVVMGTFPQGEGADKTPIVWNVIAQGDGTALLLSEQALECRAASPWKVMVPWEETTMRGFLNGRFLNNFTDAELARVLDVELANDPNPQYGTTSGANTTDKFFCLSYNEVATYLATDDDCLCTLTAHAAEGMKDGSKAGDLTAWWLRTAGHRQDMLSIVTKFPFPGGMRTAAAPGCVTPYGDKVNADNICLRPACWVVARAQ